MKDFAKSYEQLSWQFAVSEYERMQNWLLYISPAMVSYAQNRIAQLESEYPILKKENI
jgi:hypothetical protein